VLIVYEAVTAAVLGPAAERVISAVAVAWPPATASIWSSVSSIIISIYFSESIEDG